MRRDKWAKTRIRHLVQEYLVVLGMQHVEVRLMYRPTPVMLRELKWKDSAAIISASRSTHAADIAFNLTVLSETVKSEAGLRAIVVHELLHYRFPCLTEDQVNTLARVIVGRETA